MSYNSKKKRNDKRKKLTKVNLINKPLKKTIKLVKRQKSTKLGLNKKPRKKKSVKNRYGSKKKLIGGNNDCSFLKCIDNPKIFFNSDTSIEKVLDGIDVSQTQFLYTTFLYAQPKLEKINIIETIFSQLKFSPETEIGCGIIEKSNFTKDIITALIYGRDLLLGIHTILKKIEKETGGKDVRGGKKKKTLGIFGKDPNNKCDKNSLQLKRKIGIETSKIHLCYNCEFIFDNVAKKFKLVITGYKYKDLKETKKKKPIEIYHDAIVNDPELIKKSESKSESESESVSESVSESESESKSESENELKFTLKSKFFNKTFKFENTNKNSGHIEYLKKLLECLKHLGEIIDGDKSIKTFLKVSEEYIHFIDREIFPSDPSSFLIEFLNKTNIVQLLNTDSDSDSDGNSDFSKFIEGLRDSYNVGNNNVGNNNVRNNKKFFECRNGVTPPPGAAPHRPPPHRRPPPPLPGAAPAQPLQQAAANQPSAQDHEYPVPYKPRTTIDLRRSNALIKLQTYGNKATILVRLNNVLPNDSVLPNYSNEIIKFVYSDPDDGKVREDVAVEYIEYLNNFLMILGSNNDYYAEHGKIKLELVPALERLKKKKGSPLDGGEILEEIQENFEQEYQRAEEV